MHFYSAGPAKLPQSALEKCHSGFLDIGNGESILEISHRSDYFDNVINSATLSVKELLLVPSNYHVLWMQGGATLQFAATAMNVYYRTKQPIHYIISGAWSQKAYQECQNLGIPCTSVIESTTSTPLADHEYNQEGFLYYCSNETVHGVEFKNIPKHPNIICDMSSNFLSRPVDVAKFAIIYAGVQKNVGPAGVTLVIVRNDLVSKVDKIPTMMNYNIFATSNSLYNTPPVSTIYVCKYVLEWIKSEGGLKEMERRNKIKSDLIYSAIEQFQIYHCPVQNHCRSSMNITLRLLENGKPSEKLELEFIELAEMSGLFGLKGHRSVGGIRASMYNAVTVESAQVLKEFMISFAENKLK
eukprot:NODE_909_length_3159_cov_0.066013.p1 type:complete len:356 gc:universal NODE_909_length_3159_cov_0.066013:1823-2890(+)